MKKLVLIAAVAAFVSAANADVLWGKAVGGASLEEISKIYPDGTLVEPKDPSKRKHGLIYKINDIQIADKAFAVSFLLKDDKLARVSLTRTEDVNIDDCAFTYRKMAEALTSKYGVPLSKEVMRHGFETMTWTQASTTVNLKMIAYDLPFCSLIVEYNSAVADVAKNL